MTAPTYAMVRGAVAEYMSTVPGGSETLWHVRWGLVEKLGDVHDRHGNLSDTYLGQVYRALNAMVDDGRLVRRPPVKGYRDTDPTFYLPDAWEQHLKGQADAQERQAREAARRRGIKDAMAAWGFDIDHMSTDDWARIAALLGTR